MSIGIGNSTFSNVTVRPLQDNKTLQEAETILKKSEDGLDTIGFTLDGVDYLATGQGLSNPEGKNVTFNGKQVDVKFFEDENNTALEGAFGAVKSTAGIVSTVLVGAGFGLGAAALDGVGSGLLNLGTTLVGAGTPFRATPTASFLKAGAIGAGITIGIAGTIGAISGAISKGDESVINTLTK